MKKKILFNVFLFLLFISSSVHIHSQSSTGSTIFRDDFDRTFLGSRWGATYSWSIVDGAAYNFLDGFAGTLKTATEYSQSSYIIETSAKGFTAGYKREFRITFGQSNLLNDSMYVLKYIDNGGGRIFLSRSDNNIYFPTLLDEAAVYPSLSTNNWQKIKIAHYKCGLIQVYIDKGNGYDSAPILETIDSTYKTLGHFGWQEDTQGYPESFYVDWIAATVPDKEKPPVFDAPEEDKLITQISVANGKKYKVAKLTAGTKAYLDRKYTITKVPTYLNGASFIQTAMDDKAMTAAEFMNCFIKKDAIMYVGYDPRATVKPKWLESWTKTGDSIFLTDPGSEYLDVYSRMIGYGEVYPSPLFFGGNLNYPAEGSKMNYLVAAVERPKLMRLQAEDALLEGAVIAKNHPGYEANGFVDYINPTNDFIEWTVPIEVPGSYNIGIRFSNGGKYDRELQLTIDDKELGVCTFSPTWNWASWAFYTGQEVYLSKGTYKIRATAIGTSGPNVDLLSIYYTSPKRTEQAKIAFRKGKPTNEIQPETIEFSNAFPNPFTGSTRIFYSLQKKSFVKLAIHSLDGRQVSVLANGIKEKGNYNALFNSAHLPAGMYIYRLQIGDEIKVGKLIKEQ